MNRLGLLSLLLLCSCNSSGPGDRTVFFYDPASEQCQGLNPAPGPCGDFRYQKIQNKSFKNQDLRGANFSGSQLEDIDFTDSLLQGAIFDGVEITNSNLSGANFRKSSFQGVKIKNSNLSSSNFSSSFLSNCEITNNQSSAINIEGSKISYCLIEKNNWRLVLGSQSQWDYNSIINNEVQGQFAKSIFKNNQWTNDLNMVNALRSNPNLNPSLSSNLWANSNFQDSIFINNDIVLVDFTGSQFQRTTMTSNLFLSVNFSTAILHQSSLTENIFSSLLQNQGSALVCYQNNCSSLFQTDAFGLYNLRNRFDSTDFTGASWPYIISQGELYLGNTMLGINFEEGLFQDSIFNNNDLRQSNWQHIFTYNSLTLQNNDLSKSNLSYINYDRIPGLIGSINFRNSDLRESILDWSRFYGGSFEGTNASLTSIDNTLWKDTFYNSFSVFPFSLSPEDMGLILRP